MKRKMFFAFLIVITCAMCACKMVQPIEVLEQDGLYIVNLAKNVLLEPFVVDNVATNKAVFEANDFLLSMNAGYFDTVNKQTTSYVVIDEKTVLNPETNKNLTQNPKLKNNMDKILNRSELRYLACPFGHKYTVQRHNDLAPAGCKIINSIQAGPMLLPSMDLENEYFIAKDKNGNIVRNPIGVDRKVARIAVGIRENGSLSIFVATKQHPVTLNQLRQSMLAYGIKEAINFDGGGSVSLNYKNIDIFSDYENTRRQVKSFLVVKKY